MSHEFKLIEINDSLESNITLEILGIQESSTALFCHAYDDTEGLFTPFRFILLMQRDSHVNIFSKSNINIFRKYFLILGGLEM